jgi:hypothetical protein
MSDAGVAFDSAFSGPPRWEGGVDLCAAFVNALPVTGASISVVGNAGREMTVCASDAAAARLEELQFDLGEGPHREVARSGRPVLIPDVETYDHSSWPVFATSLPGLEVRAIFAFPVAMGAVTVGVVDLYSTSPGSLSPSEMTTVRRLARSVAGPAVGAAIRSADGESSTDARGVPMIRREVHQATGMVLVQLQTTATEAFSLLRAHAFATGRSVEAVSRDVVSRRLDFRHLSD